MAKDTIEIDVNVGEGVKSMKSLRAEFTDIQKELDGLIPGTQKYIDTLQKLGAVKDDVGDLKDEIGAFAGSDAKVAAFSNVLGGVASGFQAATAAGALFGAESEDLQKSLLKVQAAMALAEGVKGVLAMSDAMKSAANVAKQLAADVIGVANMQKIAEVQTKAIAAATRLWNLVLAANPILLIVAGIGLLVGAFFALDKAFADNRTQAKKLQDAYEEHKKASDELIKGIDNEIAALSGLASNEQAIIDLRKQRIEQTLLMAKEAKIAAAARVLEEEKELGFIDEMTASVSELMGKEGARQALTRVNSAESRKLLQESIDAEKKAASDKSAFENEQEQKRLDKSKEAAAKYKAIQDKKLEDEKNRRKQIADWDAEEADFKKSEEEKAKLAAEEKFKQDYINRGLIIQDEIDKAKEKLDKEKQLKAGSDAAIQEAEAKSIDAMRGLSEGFFAFKMKAAKGNAAEELKIKKQMFAVDKAFNIARAIQDGIRSVQAALTLPPPGGQILAAVNAAIAAGNIAKLSASTFDGGGAGGSADFGGGLGAGATFTQGGGVGSAQSNTTQLNQNGTVSQQNNAPIKAYVVESESAAVTKRINKLSDNAKIG